MNDYTEQPEPTEQPEQPALTFDVRVEGIVQTPARLSGKRGSKAITTTVAPITIQLPIGGTPYDITATVYATIQRPGRVDAAGMRRPSPEADLATLAADSLSRGDVLLAVDMPTGFRCPDDLAGDILRDVEHALLAWPQFDEALASAYGRMLAGVPAASSGGNSQQRRIIGAR